MTQAKPTTRELTMTRVFDAPRTLVWKAWTDQKHMAQWWGPRDFTNPVCESDARPGGKLRIVMRGPDGTDYPMRGLYEEVVEPERLVVRHFVEDAKGKTLLEVLTTVTFAEQGSKTRLTLHVAIEKADPQAAFMLEGMEEGWSQSLERLAAFLEKR